MHRATPTPDQSTYWDANLDPANLDKPVGDSAAALAREVAFARRTPDIVQMLDYITKNLPPTPPRPPYCLDVGAGLGTMTALLLERNVAVVALDISHNRLAALRANTAGYAGASRVFAVKAKAEALPFRDGALDAACSRAVLIHTDIPAACGEIARVLRPGAPVAFSEVMAHNPLVNLYRRTLAPKEWQSITTYFTDRQIGLVRSAFAHTTAKPFYMSAFIAFVFQYAVASPRLFRLALAPLRFLDRAVGAAFPRFAKSAWFILICGKAPKL